MLTAALRESTSLCALISAFAFSCAAPVDSVESPVPEMEAEETLSAPETLQNPSLGEVRADAEENPLGEEISDAALSEAEPEPIFLDAQESIDEGSPESETDEENPPGEEISDAILSEAEPEPIFPDAQESIDEGSPESDADGEPVDEMKPDSGGESNDGEIDPQETEMGWDLPCPVVFTHSLSPSQLTQDVKRTRDNPLRGFLTNYAWGAPANDFPDQMEFAYIPMKDLWGSNGPTFAMGLEPRLNEAAARGHHLIVRVYIEYPGLPSGLPPYLAEQVPCQTYTDYGGGCSPDYDHPALVSAMLELMEALGAAYDTDPRLGALQVGLLGFWGEWHTYPHTDWFPSQTTQQALLTAVHQSFPTVPIQVRQPQANSAALPIGYHDDSFAYSTLGTLEWFFWNRILAAGESEKWKTEMMGGELRPELQTSCFTSNYMVGEFAQDVVECIETTHTTYLLNYNAFNKDGQGYTGEEREAAEAAALKMGYQFELMEADLTLGFLDEDSVEATATLSISNTGLAPFYADLHVQMFNVQGDLAGESETSLQGLLPGETILVDVNYGLVSVTAFHAPLTIRLHSSRLLPDQRIELATTTPWTSGTGVTVDWGIQCTYDSQTLQLGDWAGGPVDCPCRCGVDGSVHDCVGEPCS